MPNLPAQNSVDALSRHFIHRREFRTLSLLEAGELLPVVKNITQLAVIKLRPLQTRLHALVPADPRQDTVRSQYQQCVEQWAGKIERLGLNAQGLWQVGFDSGQGWYCWQVPDRQIRYFLEYGDEFSQRRLIRDRLPYDHLDLVHQV